MNNSKKVLLVAMFLNPVWSKAENLPGRTRNLNILSLHKYISVHLSASENDSQNILRDLACNCDNPDFEMSIALKVKPFAFAADWQQFNEIIKNPVMREAVMEQYEQAIMHRTQKNVENFFSYNLKELLRSKDSEGKSALDIVKDKPDVMGCTALKEAFESMEEFFQNEEKQQNLEEEINKTQR